MVEEIKQVEETEKVIFPAVEILKKQIIETRELANKDLYTFRTWRNRDLKRGITERGYTFISARESTDAIHSFPARVIQLYIFVRPYIVNIKEKDKKGNATKEARYKKLLEIDKFVIKKPDIKKEWEKWIERFFLLDEYLYSTGLIKLSLDRELTDSGFGRR